ncbi:MAG: hypothetical protein NC409_00415, partial [Clostridium sp.]|nr:hypothetical protein [Clostridium sp.]
KMTKKNCDNIQNVEKKYGKHIQKCETYIKMHNKRLKKYPCCYIIGLTKTIKHLAHCYELVVRIRRW